MRYRDALGYAYVWRHIPTNKWGVSTIKALSHTEFYRAVARWNTQQPTQWAYAPLD